MGTEAFASPLTVWVGSARYIFPPGRDVFVGRDSRCDICLDGLDNSEWTSRIHLLLRFTGTQWMVIDRSLNGIYVDGVRVSTVDIRDGLAITAGDPRHGPRLVFRCDAAVGAPAAPPAEPTRARPSPTAQPEQPSSEPRTEPIPPTEPTPPPDQPPAQPAPAPPWPQVAERKRRNLVGRMTGAMHKLLPRRTAPSPEDTATTDPLRRADLVANEAMVSQPAAPPTSGVDAYQLGLTVDGQQVLADVSFTARPGTLTAVIGPSAGRNSALISLLGGTRQPSSGQVTVDGRNVHTESMCSRVGMVPHDDLVHRQLTVEQALGYAAELRLPPTTSADDRRHAVNQVLDDLELTPHRNTRVGKLSTERRQRASVAVELLTGPSLLVLDEPIARLDPALGHQVMAMLRRLADTGCVVVLATTSLAYLNMCDQVLLLTSAGTTAFAGPPAQIDEAMGTTDWSDMLARVSTDPGGAHDAFLAREQAAAPTAPPPAAPPGPRPAHIGLRRQISLMARRQARLVVGDRGYFIFLAILPFAFGALALVVPGHAGLGRADPFGDNPNQGVEVLVLLNIAAVIIGTALTIRDLVGERRIFRREQSVGLWTSGYATGKIIVFGLAAAVETAILTAIVILVKGAPVHGAVLLGNPVVELYLAVAATAIVSAILGLALSALAKNKQAILPMLVVVILVSLVFAGGLVPLAGRPGFDQISWLVPAQWGFAASACTVDLRRVDLLAPDHELWTHYSGWWLFNMALLIILGAVYIGALGWRLRPPGRQTSDRSLHREQQELSHLGS